MSLTVSESSVSKMLVANKQLDKQLSTELEQTSSAFQSFMHKNQDNYRNLASDNVLLSERITHLESQNKINEALHMEKEKKLLELINAQEVQILNLKNALQTTNANLQHLTSLVNNASVQSQKRWDISQNRWNFLRCRTHNQMIYYAFNAYDRTKLEE